MTLRIFPILLVLVFLGCKKDKTVFSNDPDADILHNRPVGTSAVDLLHGDSYSSLKIEIQYMAGYAPDANAIEHLKTMLNAYIKKPGGITVVTNEIPASSSTTLSLSQIKNIEETNRTAFTEGSQLAVYILYTNGNYTDDKVLGIAYRNTSVVIFGKNIHDHSGSIGQSSRTKLEATVAEHEMGHLLGLVDLGSPMQTNHRDAGNGNHCNNSNCLMYYTSETTDILGFLLTGNIPGLDANCAADLHANGGQ